MQCCENPVSRLFFPLTGKNAGKKTERNGRRGPFAVKNDAFPGASSLSSNFG